MRLKWAGSMSRRLGGVFGLTPCRQSNASSTVSWTGFSRPLTRGWGGGGRFKGKPSAFADDVILLTRTGLDMSKIFRQLSQLLESVGLMLNAKKCASHSIVGVVKSKTWYCDPVSYLVDRGTEVRGMSVDGWSKYLGNRMGLGD